MIKSTLQTNSEIKESIFEYPKLMINPEKTVIILVTSKRTEHLVNHYYTGMVVYSSVEWNKYYPVGKYNDHWVIGDYKDYHGSVLLEGIKP